MDRLVIAAIGDDVVVVHCAIIDSAVDFSRPLPRMDLTLGSLCMVCSGSSVLRAHEDLMVFFEETRKFGPPPA